MLRSIDQQIERGRVNDPALRMLVFGRLLIIFLLLLASWWWRSNYLELKEVEFPTNIFLTFLMTLALTGVYLLAARTKIPVEWQIKIQFAVDLVIIASIIRETGGVASPYAALYIVLISVSGFFLARNGTIFLAVAAAFVFSVLGAVSLKYGDSDLSESRFMQTVAFNDVAILIVGLLAGRFAERRRVSDELQETVELFSDLHILHERIVESMASGLITTDPEGKIYAFNVAAEGITGLAASDVIGRSIYDIFDGRFAVAAGRALSGGDQPVERFESQLDTGLRSAAVACTLAPLVGKTGRTTGLVLNFQDLTEIRAMEESLRRADRLAAVGRMAAGLAHELRNPLGSMSSALQFMQKRVPPSTTDAELMDVILRESDRLNRIISNFLSYASPSASVLQPERGLETEVGQAIRDCLLLLRHSPDLSASHELEIDLPERPVHVRANETQLKQVFWNLTRNSIQAMPDGGSLRVGVIDDGRPNVQITFEDTGSGIGEHALKHLFEPFAEGARGAGLGLSIVHKIVTDHGGRINVESRPDAGTRITVELPRAVSGAAAAG